MNLQQSQCTPARLGSAQLGSVRLPAQLGSRLRSGSGSAQLSSARLGSARQLRRTGAKEKQKNRQQKKNAENKNRTSNFNRPPPNCSLEAIARPVAFAIRGKAQPYHPS